MWRSLPSGWSTVKLKDGLADIIDYRGKTPPKSPYGIPLISAANVKEGRVVLDNPDYISRKDYQSWTTRGFTQPGDVLITTEAPAGEVAPYPRKGIHLISRRVMALRADEVTLHSGYLLYVLQSRTVRAHLLGLNRGTTVPRVLKTDITGITLPHPPLDEQRRIAAVLGALDDRIEVNRRMNRTLEAMAQALFRRRFVEFDGRDDLVEHEAGPIPEGWRWGTLGDVARRYHDSVHPDDVDPDTLYIGLGDMPQGSIALGAWGSAADVSSGKARFDRGDILFGKLRPYFKKVGIAPRDGICSSDILVVRPKSPEWYGIVLGLLTHDPFIDFTEKVSTGTRMPRVSWKAMSGYEMALPPKEEASAFDAVVRPFVGRILSNIEHSRTLAALRDALLPKLVSGELRVREAESVVEAAL